MKINLAVYTAQEGYSWQPGTAIAVEDLVRFKKCMGKFPSPDSMDFPFGGIFLLDDRVVFYRYHVAKKIDFRGRDALYCVLGAVSREEAAKIDPSALFSCPEFAGPMNPFPVSLDVPQADPAAVPEWLRSLDNMTLDVRISGPADKPRYDIVRKPIPEPMPPPTEMPKSVAPVESPEGKDKDPIDADGDNKPTPVPDVNKLPGKFDGPPKEVPSNKEKARQRLLTIVGVVTVIVITVVFIVIWCKKPLQGPSQKPTSGDTNVVQRGSHDQSATNGSVNAAMQTNVPSAKPAEHVEPKPVTKEMSVEEKSSTEKGAEPQRKTEPPKKVDVPKKIENLIKNEPPKKAEMRSNVRDDKKAFVRGITGGQAKLVEE